MRDVVVYELLSLDGVAEDPDQFVTAWDEAMDANLAAVIGSQDAVVLGRRSHDESAGAQDAPDGRELLSAGDALHDAVDLPSGDQDADEPHDGLDDDHGDPDVCAVQVPDPGDHRGEQPDGQPPQGDEDDADP